MATPVEHAVYSAADMFSVGIQPNNNNNSHLTHLHLTPDR